jgi:hypothetical protein
LSLRIEKKYSPLPGLENAEDEKGRLWLKA